MIEHFPTLPESLSLSLPPALLQASSTETSGETNHVAAAAPPAADTTGSDFFGEAAARTGSGTISTTADVSNPTIATFVDEPAETSQVPSPLAVAPISQDPLDPILAPQSTAWIEILGNFSLSAPGVSLPGGASFATPRQETQTIEASRRPEILATLLRRGQTMFALRDISSARLLFRRAADSGSIVAITALGKTYDPSVLSSIGAGNLQADRSIAAELYGKAIQLGEYEAKQLLADLQQDGR
jgi:hypothetical protein